MTEQRTVQLPVPEKRERKRRLWPTALMIAIVAVVGLFIARDYLLHGKRVVVTWSSVHGLRIGAPVESMQGQLAGEVTAIDVNGPTTVVTIELSRDPELADQLLRSGSKFYIERFSSRRLELKGVSSVLNGPKVFVQLGDPAAPSARSFEGCEESPPDPRVRWNSVRSVVMFDYVYDLEDGAEIKDDGNQVGVVEKVRNLPEGGVDVALAYFVTAKEICPYVRTGTRHHIERFNTDRLEIKAAPTALRGSNVAVIPGDPRGKLEYRFVGRREPPPDPRLRYDSVRVLLLAQSAEGLKAGDSVRDRGAVVGEVEAVTRPSDSDLVIIELAFYQYDPKTCPYLRSHTRYYINMAKVTTKGIEGDATTALYGAHVVVVRDPLYERDSLVNRFVAETSGPPQYLPHEGEKELRLESSEWIPADTPLVSLGEVLGYVRSCERANDSRSFYVALRVYPSGLPQVCANSVFFLQPKMEASLFRARSLVRWEGPQVRVPYPEALLRPVIELRTPPETGGRVRLEQGHPPQFRLYPEPQPEWLNWQAAPATVGASVPSEPSPQLPQPLFAHLEWRAPYKPLVSWQHRRGYVLALPNGVLGLAELLSPSVPEAKAVKPKLMLDGAVTARDTEGEVPIGEELLFLKLDPGEVARWPVASLAAGSPKNDLLVVTGEPEPQPIDQRRLTVDGGQWKVAADVLCQPAWHGAPVLCVSKGSPAYGKVIGFLSCKYGARSSFIVPFPESISKLLK